MTTEHLPFNVQRTVVMDDDRKENKNIIIHLDAFHPNGHCCDFNKWLNNFHIRLMRLLNMKWTHSWTVIRDIDFEVEIIESITMHGDNKRTLELFK